MSFNATVLFKIWNKIIYANDQFINETQYKVFQLVLIDLNS